MRRNIAKLDSFFADYPKLFDWSHPDGSCIAYPKFTGRGGVDAFCADLVEDSGVLLLPASIYTSELMATPEGHFRIGFGRKGTEEGLSAFRDYLERKHNALMP